MAQEDRWERNRAIIKIESLELAIAKHINRVQHIMTSRTPNQEMAAHSLREASFVMS